MATYNIYGSVLSQENSTGLAELEVKLYSRHTNGQVSEYLQFNAETAANGGFQFIIESGDIQSYYQSDETIQIGFEVLKGGQSVYSYSQSYVWTPLQSGPVNIFVNVQADPSLEVKTYAIGGNVKFKNGALGVNLPVRLYLQRFRETEQLAATVTSSDGRYNIILDSGVFNNLEVSKRKVILHVRNVADTEILAVSKIITISDNLSLDFEVEDESNTPVLFANIKDRITEHIDTVSIADLTEDDSAFLASTLGVTAEYIGQMVRSHQYADELNVASQNQQHAPSLVYALCSVSGFEGNPVVNHTSGEIREIILDAVQNDKIAQVHPSVINNFIAAAEEFQLTATKNLEIKNEDFVLNDVLEQIFSNSSDINVFVAAYNKGNYADPSEFWSNYETTAGSTLAQRAKDGVRIAAVTGFQPEVLSDLLAEIQSGTPIYRFAEWTEQDWVNRLSAVNQDAQRLCVPFAIRGENTNIDNDEAVLEYAKRIKTTIQDMYPLANVRGALGGASGPELIANASERSQAMTFLQNNPDFDLRVNTVYQIDPTTHNLTGVSNVEALKANLEPFQRLLRVTGGKPEAVTSMKAAGIDSAQSLVSISKEKFVTEYAEIVNGEEVATAIYDRAELIDTITTEIVLDFYQNASYQASMSGGTGVDTPFLPFYDPSPSDPNLVTLFGNLDYCSCSECLSVYSPAAYFTDILNFLLKNATPLYNELVRRRPDLLHIDLSCKNTNTAVPYIDLVNELLESLVLKQMTVTPPVSYQTSAAAKELAAHPEHIYKQVVSGVTTYEDYTGFDQVYDTALANAIYPDTLPFNFAMEITRVYLQHMGISRGELMKYYVPYTAISGGLTDRDRYTEMLGMSKTEVDIILKAHASSNSPWLFYGIKAQTTNSSNGLPDPANSTAVLSGDWITNILVDRPDALINQLRISYKSFLQLLTTDFLNKVVSGTRLITITVDNGSISESTCDLTKLRLAFTSPATASSFFDKLYRFVRFWKSSGMSIHEFDTVLRTLNITEFDTSSFNLFGRVLAISRKLNVRPEYLAMWWSNIDTTRYINYGSETQDNIPSLYDVIFRNKAVVNVPIDDYDDPGSLPSNYNGQLAIIAAFARISEEDVVRILAFFGITRTALGSTAVQLKHLSRICIFAILAKSINYTVKDLLALFSLLKFDTDGNTPSNNPLDQNYSNLSSNGLVLGFLEKISDVSALISKSGFSFMELQFLSQDWDESAAFTVPQATIQQFYEGLRRELQKYPADNTDGTYSDELKNKLKNTVYQQITKQFNLPFTVAKELSDTLTVDGVSSPDKTLTQALIHEKLIVSDFELSYASFTALESQTPRPVELPDYNTLQLIDRYKLISKMAGIIAKLNMSAETFIYLYGSPSVVDFDFKELPVDGTPSQNLASKLFEGVIRLSQWITVKHSLRMDDEDFAGLLQASSSGNKNNWVSLVEANTQWGALLTEFVGVPPAVSAGDNGILNTNFSQDFIPSDNRSAQRILDLYDAIKWCVVMDMSPETIHASLKSAVQLSDARKILLAAKGKHDESAWLKIAKPLRDVLREKQRDALAAYIIAHPDEPYDANNRKVWRNHNELYAHLLIDIDMQACMMTSRLKQAISSVQLFVDRVLLGIEYENYQITTAAKKLELSSSTVDLVKQWDLWRKWYRVWEANRKIFLYPENWIEPELRDGKSVFFEELETELLQDELTDAKATDAITNYVMKLDGVARLEPAGSCYDWVTGITHVFSRTYGDPHYYYYRRLENNEWTPWERVDLDIKGEHVIPVVWSNRLYLFWLTFKDKIGKINPIDISPYKEFDQWGNEINNRYWDGNWHFSPWFYNGWGQANLDTSSDGLNQLQIEITLNWSEYKDGKWSKHKVGTNNMLMKLNPTVDRYYRFHIAGGTQEMNLISQNRTLTITELIKSRFYLYPYVHKPDSDNVLYLWVMFPDATDFGWRREHQVIQSFRFIDNNREPEVYKEWAHEWRFPSPWGTFTQNMRHIKNPIYNKEELFTDIIRDDSSTAILFYDYMHDGNVYPGTLRRAFGSEVILHKTPFETYKVKSRSNFGDNPMENHFFYEDNAHTFFARVVELDQYAIATTTGSSSGGPFTVPLGTGTGSTTAYTGGTLANAPNWTLLVGGNSNLSLATAGNVAATLYPVSSSNNALTLPVSSVINSNVAAFNATFKVLTPDMYFQTFYHPHTKWYTKALSDGGVDKLMKMDMQSQFNWMHFDTKYVPNNLKVLNHQSPSQYTHPHTKVDFDYWGAYSSYNWELFFHIPMMIAQRLSDNQKFEEARKWYQYIFDPTCNLDEWGNPTTSKQRFWRFWPFYNEAGKTVETLSDLLDKIHSNDPHALNQITRWQNNPFKPHLIARYRILAYMKNVVMKYIDNLIAWGDQLFRRDTIESINEATQLYILAANILGRKPQEIPSRVKFTPKTFTELLNTPGGIDAFSNAKVKIESYVSPNGPIGGGSGVPSLSTASVFYFCTPKNEKLVGYWDTVADRLFKIRNCMNIDGQKRELPLFEPPIDPGMLVKAAAAGIDTASLLDDMSSGAPLYKFSYITQKANELCSDVKALGGALLSAIEKKDAEHLAVLRSGLELSLLEKVKAVKEEQIKESEANIEALRKSKEITLKRYDYYNSRVYMNPKEKEHMALLQAAIPLHNKQADRQRLSSILAIIPTVNLQLPMASGPSFGGGNLSSAANAFSSRIGAEIAINNTKSGMAQAIAGYDRRRDDWQFQAQSALNDAAQIDKQIITAEIRKSIAEKELENHLTQIENNIATDEYMRSKFTNEQLYNWMISQISTTYFQSYQLAYDMAKKAEKCFDYELPRAKKPATGYIKFGYWDSLKKGLLSGEKLQLDLRKLETAYIENNERELELTKHISLALTNPRALLDLIKDGSCHFFIPEELFDLDYPGHYYRRIKSVSISIPCITGPYTTIAAELTLVQCAVRKLPDSGGLTEESIGAVPRKTIATSSAQNDSGVFEVNFKDERYLPFEGRGAVSRWSLKLSSANQLRLFDFKTISDIVIHLKYTAISGRVESTVISNLNESLAEFTSENTLEKVNLPRYFSLKHEFAEAWSSYSDSHLINHTWNRDMFPVFCTGKNINIVNVYATGILKLGQSGIYRLKDTQSGSNATGISAAFESVQTLGTDAFKLTPIGSGSSKNVTLKIEKQDGSNWVDVNIDDVFEDIYLVLFYTI